MIKQIDNINENIKQHLRDNVKAYILILFSVIIGIIVGIYLGVTGYKYTSLLTTGDKLMFDYITGTASYMSIFYSRISVCIISIIIIFVFNLTYYLSFFNYLYIGYQSALLVLSSIGIISLKGLAGIINVVLFLIPLNLLNLFILSLMMGVSIERAREQFKFKSSFYDSFYNTNYLKKISMCACCLFVVCLFSSLILPLIFKSFIIILY